MTHSPSPLRLLSILRLPGEHGLVYNEAVLYHDATSEVNVCWSSSQVDPALVWGGLVEMVGLAAPTDPDAPAGRPIAIAGLIAVAPAPGVNPFVTIPPRWRQDRDAIANAAACWNLLNSPSQGTETGIEELGSSLLGGRHG